MNSTCSICYNSILNNIVSLKCNHHYHLECLYNLIKQKKKYSNKCPLCRLEFLNPIEDINNDMIDIIEYEEYRHSIQIFLLLLSHFVYSFIILFFFHINLHFFNTILFGFLTGYYFILIVWK